MNKADYKCTTVLVHIDKTIIREVLEDKCYILFLVFKIILNYIRVLSFLSLWNKG